VKFRSLTEADVRGKRVLLREDLNVPMKNGGIGDETRITAALTVLVMKSRLSCAMCSTEISFGHAASHSR